MKNVRRLVAAPDKPLRYNTGEWDRRARRFLLDLRMLGLGPPEIAEMLRELLEVVEPRQRSHAR
jgi:hypothetical protein